MATKWSWLKAKPPQLGNPIDLTRITASRASIKDLEEVKNNIEIQSYLDMYSGHVCSTNIRPSDNDTSYLANKWRTYLKEYGLNILSELIGNGEIYGYSIAAINVVQLFNGWKVITDLLPYNLSQVSFDTYTGQLRYQYNSKIINTDECWYSLFYSKATLPYQPGKDLAEVLKRLSDVYHTETDACVANGIGSLVGGVENPTGAPVDPEVATAFLTDVDNMLSAKRFIPNFKVTNITNKDRRDFTGFDNAVKHNKELILNRFALNWLLLGVSNTGAYSGFKAWLQTYQKKVSTRAQSIAATFTNLAKREAEWNGLNEHPIFVFDECDLATEKKDKKEIILNNARDFLDRGVVTVNEVRDLLELPKIEEPIESTPVQALDERSVWLDKKKQGVKKALEKSIVLKAPFHLTEYNRYAQMFNQDEASVKQLWASAEQSFKNIISDGNLNNFELEWLGFCEALMKVGQNGI